MDLISNFVFSSFNSYSFDNYKDVLTRHCVEGGNCLKVLDKKASGLSIDVLKVAEQLNKQYQREVEVIRSIDLINTVSLSEDIFTTIENFKRLTNRCNELINQIPFSMLFNEIDPCAIMDFTRIATWQRNVHIYESERISIDGLQELADQIARTDRFKKYHIPGGRRKQLEASLNILVQKMKQSNIDSINFSSAALFAERQIIKAKESGKVGECYIVESKKGFILPYREYVSVSPGTQKSIEQLFQNQRLVKKISKNESLAMKSGRLNELEIKELRAIRKATELFEKNTFLKDDKAGGFLSNIQGELFGGGQQNCVDEEITYRLFLQSLSEQGFLKHFYVGSRIEKLMSLRYDWSDSGHVAGTLVNRRTGEVFVIDSWYEPGGTAAHIQTKEDWKKTPISYFGSLNFNDVVELED